MEYKISKDMKIVRELLNMSQSDLAKELDVEILTIQRIENELTGTSSRVLNRFYDFVFQRKIYLNKLKEMFYLEELSNEKLLFHGAKKCIEGDIDISKSRSTNDFGKGFYCGESYEQSASFVENFENSRIYFYAFNQEELKSRKYSVNQEWMITIAYYRGKLDKYKDHDLVKGIINKLEGLDYVIAPIADNKMFRIIDSFIDGEITDEQCKHCLAATNLGFQYVFLNDKALSHLKMLECCFLSNEERKNYRNLKNVDNKISDDKVKMARIQYRGKGLYIDEILK